MPLAKYTAAIEPLLEGINCGSDTWKIALAANVNTADTTFVAGTTDLPTAGGYTAGGMTCTVSSSTHSSGTYKLILNDPGGWTATGVGFVFGYVILYNSTNNIPVAYVAIGSNVVMSGSAGDSYDIILDIAEGVIQVS
jgi:hypothetical protein